MNTPVQTRRVLVSEAERHAATLRTMTPDDLDAVMAIEQAAYSHPWSRMYSGMACSAGTA